MRAEVYTSCNYHVLTVLGIRNTSTFVLSVNQCKNKASLTLNCMLFENAKCIKCMDNALVTPSRKRRTDY